MVGYSGILDTGWVEDQKMIKDKLTDGKIVSRFRGILQKAKVRYSEEKAAEYYLQNKEMIKEKSRERYKNLSQEEKVKIKEYQRKRYQELAQYKKEALKNK